MGKVCCTCGQTLPLEDFNRDKGKKDGRGSQCRECKKIADTQYRKDNKKAIAKGKARHYQDNKEKIDSRNKKYYEDHRESTAKYQAQYRKNNKERLSEMAVQRYEKDKERVKKRAKKYYQDNRKRVCEYHYKFYQNNKDRVLRYQREYQQKNKDKVFKYQREYYQNNRDIFVAHSAKYEASKLNQTPMDADLRKIQLYYAVCSETNDILGDVFFHVDHIKPLSKGGLHHEDNLQILEVSLNLQKKAKWPLSDEEQAKYRGITL